MNDWSAEGATAEFCFTLPSAVAPKPAAAEVLAAFQQKDGPVLQAERVLIRHLSRQPPPGLLHGRVAEVGDQPRHLGRAPERDGQREVLGRPGDGAMGAHAPGCMDTHHHAILAGYTHDEFYPPTGLDHPSYLPRAGQFACPNTT